MKRYVVFVDDNFHPQDEEHRYRLGEFDDAEQAISACRRIVDAFLAAMDQDKTADAMWESYVGYGEDPFIVSDDAECRFSAWTYAKERCALLGRK